MAWDFQWPYTSASETFVCITVPLQKRLEISANIGKNNASYVNLDSINGAYAEHNSTRVAALSKVLMKRDDFFRPQAKQLGLFSIAFVFMIDCLSPTKDGL